jgi:hypothetical protein
MAAKTSACHASNADPLKLPQTPRSQEFGNASAGVDIPVNATRPESQLITGSLVMAQRMGERAGVFSPAEESLSCQGPENAGNLAQVISQPGLEAEIDRLLAERGGNLSGRLSRTRAFDDFARGRLVTLLGIGLSQRQAAAALGVSHTAVQGELARHPDLAEEVTAARFQAQIEPLLVILRESKRSWRAASWLVNYLSRQLAGREETPDEALARAREELVARRLQDRADKKEQKEYDRKIRERDEQRELNRERAVALAVHGDPSPEELRLWEEEQRKIKELFEKFEAETEAAG